MVLSQFDSQCTLSPCQNNVTLLIIILANLLNYFAAGKVVSQKKDELNHILDQFNIQVS